VAIAPTATISNIIGVDASIEPCFGNLSVKSNLSGEFTVINEYLVRDLKRLGLWDDVMVMDLKHFDGSLRRIDRVPEELKQLYATAFEVETQWLVEAAARRQKWIDQAQSLNIYMAGASGKKLDETYKLAWLRGLKTTYYLRTMGATHAEKSTISAGSLNACRWGRRVACPRWRPRPHRPGRDGRGCAGHRHQVLRDRRPGLRGLPVSRDRPARAQVSHTRCVVFVVREGVNTAPLRCSAATSLSCICRSAGVPTQHSDNSPHRNTPCWSGKTTFVPRRICSTSRA
jgi:ribonucleotide reductase alpha subunit